MDPEAGEEEDVDPEVLKAQQEAADPYETRLKPITEDACGKGGVPAWVLRCHGDMSHFQALNPKALEPKTM